MTVAQNYWHSRELKTAVKRGLQSDTSHLAILNNFQGCISSFQGARTRISFRIARPRISIALSGNALARGVANAERTSGSISRKPNSWGPSFAAMAPGDGGAFSLLVERTCLVSPRSGLLAVFSPVLATILGAYPHLFRHKCAEGDLRRTTRDSLSSSRRHPSRRIVRQSEKKQDRETRKRK